MVDRQGDILGLFSGVMPCRERQVRGIGDEHKPPLPYCTSAHPPSNPHGPAATGGTAATGGGGGEGGDGDTSTGTGVGIDTMRNHDNSWTSLVPLATVSSRRDTL